MTNDQKIIYVVTSGEYSGYGIHAAFDSLEMANLFIAKFLSDSGDHPGIVELPLNLHNNGLRLGESSWLVRFNAEGVVESCEPFEYSPDERVTMDNREQFKGSGYWTGWARDESHALKIAQDQIAQAKAEAAGIS